MRLASIVCLLALVAVGCGSGSAAKAARDDVPTAGKAMGNEPCLEGEEAVPWTFDMDGTTRGSLFSGMDSGLVLVQFDCKKLKVLSRCKATGNYDYGYYPSEAEVLDFKDSDEIKANLNGGAAIAAKFEAEMKRGAKLFIAYAVGGRSTTTVPDIAKDQVKGPKACDKATHYVAEVHFGAYKMEASAGAEMKAAVDIFGRGASAGSQSSAETAGKSGDPNSCERGSDRDREPPRGCNTVVRVTLAPILPAGEGGKPEASPVKAELPRPPPGCPPGMERIGMMCRRAGGPSARPRMCRPGDASDCERQCQSGEPVSCAIAGAMYERGSGVRPVQVLQGGLQGGQHRRLHRPGNPLQQGGRRHHRGRGEGREDVHRRLQAGQRARLQRPRPARPPQGQPAHGPALLRARLPARLRPGLLLRGQLRLDHHAGARHHAQGVRAGLLRPRPARLPGRRHHLEIGQGW
jgi:hypothetical protein